MDISAIKSQLGIVEVMQSYFPDWIPPASGCGACRCPLHEDNSPSCSINTEQGLFNCYAGCGGGDVIRFVQKATGLDVPGACADLVDRFGLAGNPGKSAPNPVTKKPPDCALADTDAGRMAAALADNRAARDYLAGRGLTDAVIRRYSLGYADSGAMAGRVTFPVHDTAGRCIGFTGRAINDGQGPKYLHSKGLKKSVWLYGLFQVTDRHGRPDCLHLVEGPICTLALAQQGIPAVACFGASLSREQAARAFDVADTLVLSFDGDKAGQDGITAAAKNILPLLSGNRQACVTPQPAGHDPASFLQQYGIDAFTGGATDVTLFEWLEQHPGAGYEKMLSWAALIKPGKAFESAREFLTED